VAGQGGPGGSADARDHVQHARGEARLDHQLAQQQGGQRGLLGRLEDDRATGRQCRGHLPHRHQVREVPRHDRGHYADRLWLGVGVEARAVVLEGREVERAALDLGGPPGHVAQVLGAHADLDGPGDVQELALLQRFEAGDLLAAGLDQVGETHHHGRPLVGWSWKRSWASARSPAPPARSS
jgi:hypothetical protein